MPPPIVSPTSTSAQGIWGLKTARNAILDFSWPRNPIPIAYLIAAGGGGGGSDMGGGGGGGGVLTNTGVNRGSPLTEFLLAPGSYPIVVGNGGAGAPAGTSQPKGSNGGDSSAFGMTAIGGGGGASTHNNPNSPAGSGGCGGGGSGGRASNASYGGAHGLGTPGQGFDGAPSGTTWYPGGGGGAGRVAGVFTSLGVLYYTNESLGGLGRETSILRDRTRFNNNLFFGGGGGGAAYSRSVGGSGGTGGGGAGAVGSDNTGGMFALNNDGGKGGTGSSGSQTNQPGGNAGVNSGGGGGGGSHYNVNNNGGNGAAGAVIIRYDGIQKFTGGIIYQWAEELYSNISAVPMESRFVLRTAHIFYESGTLVG